MVELTMTARQMLVPELAERAGVSMATIYRIHANARLPRMRQNRFTPRVTGSVARALGMNVERLFHGWERTEFSLTRQYGNPLAIRMDERKLDIAEFAELCGISTSTVYNALGNARVTESKYHRLHPKTAVLMAEVLDSSVDVLFGKREISRSENGRMPGLGDINARQPRRAGRLCVKHRLVGVCPTCEEEALAA